MSHQRVVVVGAGVSGLTSALALAEAGFDVEVYEAQERAGGLIRTETTQYGLAEAAANGIINSVAVEKLLERLKVPFVGVQPQGRARYVLVDGRPQRWPFSLGDSLQLFGRLVRLAVRGKTAWQPHAGETVEQWTLRHLGRSVNDRLLAPALLGVYASRTSDLSATLLMNSRASRTQGKLSARPRVTGTIAPLHGMGSLVDALEKTCRELGVRFYFGQRYDWSSWDGGATPHVYAGSVFHAARDLGEVAPRLAQQLKGVRVLPVASLTAFYPREAAFLKGFGCLFAESEGMECLGVLFPGDLFRGRTSVHSETWIVGGARHPGLVDGSEDEIVRAVRRDRRRLAGQEADPLATSVFRWPEALPYYDLYLEEVLADLQLPRGLFLNGNYLGQIGLAGLIERGLRMPSLLGQRGG